MREEDSRGLLWRLLPSVETADWGKLGPGIGYGLGCGVGIGAGIIGGAGFGMGFPGLQLGVGFGAGCGLGVGFGYGLGKGRAYDENGRYSNIGKFKARRNATLSGIDRSEIGAMLDDFVSGVKRALDTVGKKGDWK